MSNEVLVKVENVSKKFCRNLKKSLWYGVWDIVGELFGRSGAKSDLRSDEFWAVRDVSFELKRGEVMGLIGSNGAGKSTLLKILNGLIKPDKGKITIRGKTGALIELGAGFNPILTGRENIYINAAVLGIPKAQVNKRLDAIIDFADIDDFIEMPVQSYSSGMKVRLGFSVATQFKPAILLLDEILAVGDVSFQRKCLDYIGNLVSRNDTTVIFVSHNLRNVEQICNRAIWLEQGIMRIDGSVDEVIAEYLYEINRELVLRHKEIKTGREGSGEIRYTDVEVTSLVTGNTEIKAGESINVKASFKCYEPRDFARFRIGLWDVSTQTMITMANCDIYDLASDGEVICKFHHLNLCPRTYSVYLSITDLKLNYDRWPNAKVFTVKGARNENTGFSVGDSDLIHVPCFCEVNLQAEATL